MHSGFLFLYDALGLDRDSYRVHYRFEQSGVINNSAPDFPQLSGVLSSIGNFFSHSETGFFTGQALNIQNATGLSSDFWTHIFLLEKTGAGKGVLFDSLQTGEIYSGYSIGINDNNRLYFESYDSSGPFSRTSNLVLGKRNLVAVTKTNNLLSFYSSDFNNDNILADSFIINGNFVLPSSKGTIGTGLSQTIERTPFTGYLDEYIYINDALSPFTLKTLFSGLCSNYVLTSGTVSGFNTLEITGYSTGITGVTGVTGFSTQITGSGLDPFSTGTYQFFYGNVGLTGYITSGLKITPLTGFVAHNLTGDNIQTLTFNTGLAKSFVLDEVSFIKKITKEDISTLSVMPYHTVLNKEGGYNLVEGKFQLDDSYEDSVIQIYLNGVSQISTGYAVTGNFYGSGVQLSGDYRLDGFLIDSTGFFKDNDVLVFDLISGQKRRILVQNPFLSGQENLVPGTDHVFFNGILLISGMDYDLTSSGSFRWQTDQYSTTTGALSTFIVPSGTVTDTGRFFNTISNLYRKSSQLYLNGQRQHLNENYLENSALDLINQSGIFDTTLISIYNNQQNFFE